MATSTEINIKLPNDLAARFREKVASGRYDSEGDLIAESLAALDERDMRLDLWVQEEVVPAYDRWEADPTLGSTLDDAFDRLQDRIQHHSKQA